MQPTGYEIRIPTSATLDHDSEEMAEKALAHCNTCGLYVCCSCIRTNTRTCKDNVRTGANLQLQVRAALSSATRTDMATKLKEAPLPQLSRPMAVKRMRHKKGVSVAAGTGRSGRDGVHDGRADAGGKGKWNRQARHPEIAKPLGSADNSGGSLVQRHRLEVSQCPGCSNSVSWLRSWRRALIVGQNSRHFRTYGLKAQMLQTISTTRPSCKGGAFPIGFAFSSA